MYTAVGVADMMGADPRTFALGDITWLIFVVGALSLVLVCLVAIGLGLVALRSSRRDPSSRVRRRWATELVRWGVFAWPDANAAVVEDIARAWARVSAPAFIGLGVVPLLYLALFVVPALRSGQVPAAALALSSYPFYAGFYCCLLLGIGAGYCVGVIWAAALARGPRYADLRPRRAADYRAGVLRWLPVIVIAGVAGLSASWAPQLGPGSGLHLSVGGIAFTLTASLWTLEVLPALMALVALAGEFLIARIAHLPRLLITADAQTARRADDLLRANMIGGTQANTCWAAGTLGMAQCALLIHVGLPAVSVARATDSVAVTLVLLLSLGLTVAGYLLLISRGRLGGSRSGWPWQPAPAGETRTK